MLKKLSIFKDSIFPKNDFRRGIWWNFLSFLVLGISGVLLNVLILLKYGTSALGAFNQVYAVYILVSQLAVFGIYASVLKYVSEYAEDKEATDEILSAAIFLGGLSAAFISVAYWFSIPFLAKIFGSSDVERGLRVISFGLWFFSMNKILLPFVNGKRLMKEYAIFYMLRYFMLPFSLTIFIVFSLPSYFSPAVFTTTEIILFFVLAIFVSRHFSFVPLKKCGRWFKQHLLFGAKSFIGAGATEMNSRVDVIILGAFLSDISVGIYSFAAMLAEGMMQIPSIFKVNYNPVLTQLVSQKRLSELVSLVKNFLRKWTWPAILIGTLNICLYFFVANVFFGREEALASWIVFSILMAGVIVRSGYDVFWELPSQSGHPGYQTILISVVFFSNIILNFILISLYGIYGAAAELILSAVLGIVILKLIARKIIGVKI